MNHKFLFLLLSLGFFLAACTANPITPTPSATAVPSPAATLSLPTSAPATPAASCSTVNTEPTAVPASIVPAAAETDYNVGPADAPVTMIEYCDFQAPICRSMAAVVSNVIHNHPKDIRFIFRPVPLIDRLDKTELAVQAVIAADGQGKFWEMYDALFQRSDEWDKLAPSDFETWLKQTAAGLGMDAGSFSAALKSPETVTRMKSLYDAARTLGLQAVPLVIINGSVQPSFAIDYNSMEATISLLTLSSRQFKTCPPFSIDPAKQYIATLHTAKGEVVLQLFPDQAPLAVNSFVFLARQGWYNGVTFHRVIPGFIAQTGDPSGTGKGNPGYFFKDEIDPNLKFDKPGVVGMANSGPDTNGSQFFITFAPQPNLDGSYTVFGQVLSGMDVLEQLTPRDPVQSPNAAPGDLLLGVDIEEK